MHFTAISFFFFSVGKLSTLSIISNFLLIVSDWYEISSAYRFNFLYYTYAETQKKNRKFVVCRFELHCTSHAGGNRIVVAG